MGPDAALSVPQPATRQLFRRKLLSWYRANGRTLPWRTTSDPYHILVSEVMLQQTQVDRVLPKYHEWLRKYPSFEALAAADEADVSATWRPLGYNIRPKAAPCHRARKRGALRRPAAVGPRDAAVVQGIGAYTAGAIRSFAFRQRAAILDTNVARVLFRVFVAKGDPKAHAMRRHLWELSEALVPYKHVFDFNQG
jgi:A/G-specific adenine glycosylase